MLVLTTLTFIDYRPWGIPHAFRLTIVERPWPADVSVEKH